MIMLFNKMIQSLLLEKRFPLQGERAHSLNFVVVCMYVNRKEEEQGRQNNNYRAINLPKVITDYKSTT